MKKENTKKIGVRLRYIAKELNVSTVSGEVQKRRQSFDLRRNLIYDGLRLLLSYEITSIIIYIKRGRGNLEGFVKITERKATVH